MEALAESKIRKAFETFHQENPAVYRIFTRFALEAAQSGRRCIGSKLIFERMRWYTLIETKGDQFKLNNNYTAHYARMFLEDHPQYDGLFKTRKLRA